jgi:hypothetical protein
MVSIWSATTGEIMYYLPGHKGSVNEVPVIILHRSHDINLN